MHYRELQKQDDAALAALIRYNLKSHQLDLPGTVYFDEGLDHLSEFYGAEPKRRAYFVYLDEEDKLAGGVGLAEFTPFPDCCELQKLYLADSAKGHGLSYRMIALVEEKARELGYARIYLETHTNLETAIHVYEKSGYREIERPKSVMHGTMNRFYLKEL